ncbi:Mitochondrial carrier domain [Phytophthora cactorum]|nr:Mitochondrial carrier domain [Phytophthora cactorum]
MAWLEIAKDLNAVPSAAWRVLSLATLWTPSRCSSRPAARPAPTCCALSVVSSAPTGCGTVPRSAVPHSLQRAINAAIFGVQGHAVHEEDAPLSNTQHFVAGSLAGLVQVVFAAPSEHVKIQLQTGAMGKEHSSLNAARTMYRRYGMKTLFKGWEACLLRDAPSFGVYFCCYEATKRALTEGKTEHETDWKLMTAGGIAGMVSWAMCMPFDVVKSCVQGQKLEGKQMSMLEIARSRVKQEGPGFFFRGFGTTMVRAFPVSGVTFLVYEKTILLMS